MFMERFLKIDKIMWVKLNTVGIDSWIPFSSIFSREHFTGRSLQVATDSKT